MADPPLEVPLSYRQPQTSLRLLELPPSLLALLTSSNPPTLHFKAPPATPLTLPQGAAEPHASLVTSDKVYSVRQVQTSNSVYVVQPDGGGGVSIVSTVGTYVELAETQTNAVAVVRMLVPVFEAGGQGKKGYEGGKEGVRNDACVPDREFERAWRECVCFEHEGRAWRVDAESALKLLKKIEEVRILGDGETGWWRELAEEMEGEEGWVENLGKAIVEKLEEKDTVLQWIARLVLEAKAKEPLYREKFAGLWKQALPGGFEVHGEEIAGDKDKLLAVVQGFYSEPSPGKIQFKEPVIVVEEAAKAKPKGKWHEKFATRRLKS